MDFKIKLIEDEVGNITKITFPKTTLKYEWSINKKTNQIKELKQKIEGIFDKD